MLRKDPKLPVGGGLHDVLSWLEIRFMIYSSNHTEKLPKLPFSFSCSIVLSWHMFSYLQRLDRNFKFI